MSDKRLDLPSPGSPNFEQRVRETIQVYLGRTGDPLDRGLTVRDLKALGLLDTVDGTDGRELEPGPILPRPRPDDGEDFDDLTPPPTPTGFALSAGITYVFLEHDPPNFPQGRGYERTVFYGVRVNAGDALPTFADAAKLGDFQGEVHAHPSDPATTWHMWITWMSRNGVESVTPAGGINGLRVRTGEDVQRLLDALNGQIDSSVLNEELSERIEDAVEGVQYLGTQYGLKVQVGADGKQLVGGFAAMGSVDEGRGPTIDFGVLANRFYVGAPAENGGISTVRPFIIQTTPAVINGVEVPAGVYIEDGFIKNGTITNAKIGNAAIDDAKVANLSASKLRTGSIAVGQYIQSSGFVAGHPYGWRINGDGTADFRQVEVRGGVFARYGDIGGILINQNGLYTGPYASGTGFYLGKDGNFSLGNKLTWNGTLLKISGSLEAADGTFKGSLQAASGTFKGELQAATGTFSGKLTAQAIDAVDTLNIKGNAVTIPVSGVYSHSVTGSGIGEWKEYASMSVDMDAAGTVLVTASVRMGTDGTGWRQVGSRLLVNGQQVSHGAIDTGYHFDLHAYKLEVAAGQRVTATVQFYGETANVRMYNAVLTLLGIKR